MKTDIYGCFDKDTVIMYALPDDKDKFYYDSIKNVYEKYQGQTIEVYNEYIISNVSSMRLIFFAQPRTRNKRKEFL